MNKNKTSSPKAKDSKYKSSKSKLQTEEDTANKDPNGQTNRGHGPKNLRK